MSDLLDGTGEVVTDGDGSSVYDGSGPSGATPVTVTTSPDAFTKRIQRDIHAPAFVIEPFLNEVIRDFTEKTWVLFRSFEIQGSGVEESAFSSVAVDFSTSSPGLIPIRVNKLKVNGIEYGLTMRAINGSASRVNYEITGTKLYEFFATEEGGDETSVRVYPWDSDPLFFISVAFRTADEPESFPRILLDYKEEICSGVMSRMMMQPGKDWSEPNLAMFRDGIYQRGVNKAKLRWFQENTSRIVTGRRFV